MWDTPLDTTGHTFNVIKVYTNGTGATKDVETDGFCLHEDLLHALRRPFLRVGVPGIGHAEGSGDRYRDL